MLNKIVEAKKIEVQNLKLSDPIEVEHFSLLQALQEPNHKLGLIAEVKKASPSKGIIKKDFDPLKIAKQYQAGLADALSVLTDEDFFQGHQTYLSMIKKHVNLPVLRKDFIIDSKQIEQSCRIGADAILLIATILEKNQLHEFYQEAYQKGLECLVEVHSFDDVEKVLSTFKPKILGVNNRNLKTFETNLNQTLEIAKHLPKDILVVSESGIKSKADIEVLEGNADAILVGETLMRAATPITGIELLFDRKRNEDSAFT